MQISVLCHMLRNIHVPWRMKGLTVKWRGSCPGSCPCEGHSTDASCASADTRLFGPMYVGCKAADGAISEADILCKFEVLLVEVGL